jgi:hypothetical protein
MDDNELIAEKSWWPKHFVWIIPLVLLIWGGVMILLAISEVNSVKQKRENGVLFDHSKWQARDDNGYIYRNRMLKDLTESKQLKGLEKSEVMRLLGQPDRVDNGYLFYRVAQQRIGLFPLHTTTLVIRFSERDSVTAVLIHE